MKIWVTEQNQTTRVSKFFLGSSDKVFQLNNCAKEFPNLWKENSHSLSEWVVLCISARWDDSPRNSGIGPRKTLCPDKMHILEGSSPTLLHVKEVSAEDKENEADGQKGALGEIDRQAQGEPDVEMDRWSPVPVPSEAQPTPMFSWQLPRFCLGLFKYILILRKRDPASSSIKVARRYTPMKMENLHTKSCTRVFPAAPSTEAESGHTMSADCWLDTQNMVCLQSGMLLRDKREQHGYVDQQHTSPKHAERQKPSTEELPAHDAIYTEFQNGQNEHVQQ